MYTYMCIYIFVCECMHVSICRPCSIMFMCTVICNIWILHNKKEYLKWTIPNNM